MEGILGISAVGATKLNCVSSETLISVPKKIRKNKIVLNPH